MWRFIAVAAGLFIAGCNCGGSRGVLVGAGKDVGFVKEQGAAVVSSTADGIAVLSLDGARRRVLFKERMTVEDVSGDYATWVGSDSETNLFIGDLRSGAWRRVKELDGIASSAAISPDGTRVIASRHSDFNRQGSPDEDTLFLIDVASLAVEVLPKTTDHWPTGLRWSEDGKGVLATMAFDKPSQWVDLVGKKRTATQEEKSPLHENPARRRASCDKKFLHDKFDVDIKIQDETGKTIVVVKEEGRKRGFHDYQDDFGSPQWTPRCDYVLFTWEGAAWLADAKGSGEVGPLFTGEVLFFADPKLLDP